MKREYWFIIIAYITMQFSGSFGAPLLKFIGLKSGLSVEQAVINAMAYWSIFSFIVTLLVVIFFLRKELSTSAPTLRGETRASVETSIAWAIAGVFIAFFAQYTGVVLETLIGIEQGSENTQTIVNIIAQVPLFALIVSIVGPILEEIVFRKVIFGTLYKKYSFFVSALISSLIFGFAHFEPEHIILYSAMGFTFAFLYVKTQRILVPIFAHIAMNTIVVVAQLLLKDDIEKIMNEMNQVQSFIGGLL